MGVRCDQFGDGARHGIHHQAPYAEARYRLCGKTLYGVCSVSQLLVNDQIVEHNLSLKDYYRYHIQWKIQSIQNIFTSMRHK